MQVYLRNRIRAQELHNESELSRWPFGLVSRARPVGLPSHARRKLILTGEADANGWQEIELPVSSTHLAVSEFLRLGNELEILSPVSLREAMRTTVNTLATRYERGIT